MKLLVSGRDAEGGLSGSLGAADLEAQTYREVHKPIRGKPSFRWVRWSLQWFQQLYYVNSLVSLVFAMVSATIWCNFDGSAGFYRV